jgi:division protein CdvB (Snf7/Vps24/ESCRT-III family)
LRKAIFGNPFVDKWKDKERQPSLTSKIKSIGKPPQNIKQQISLVTKRIDVQAQTLEDAVKRFLSHDAAIFKCVVKALSERDKARANIFANELWEIRKVEKMLTSALLALESISMRLNTVSKIGDLITLLTPTAGVLNNIRSGMSTVLPEASRELETFGSLLTDIVTSTNQSVEIPVNIGIVNADAEEILEEAELAAEKRLREQFPEVATEVAKSKQTSLKA